MKGDFTRSTFKAKKHYNSVRMQQGRVQLDADWNEQADITRHRLERSMRDLIGPAGGPSDGAGFRIVADEGDIRNFQILAGRYYVDGVMCEIDENTTFVDQSDRLLDDDAIAAELSASGLYLVYLDVWDRHITAIEDDGIREPALGGADTTSRVKTVWQVRCQLLRGPDGEDLPLPPRGTLVDDYQTTGTMSVRITGGQLENHLYRVEIHDSGTVGSATGPSPTFKWSRDNGAVAVRLDPDTPVSSDTELLIVGSARQLKIGDRLELITEANELEGTPGTRHKIAAIDGSIIKLEEPHGLTAGNIPGPAKLRRWDTPPDNDNAEEVLSMAPGFTDPDLEEGWIELEQGISVRFLRGESYKSGDYWNVPVRVGIEETEERTGLTTDGIEHRYAHLALVQYNGATVPLTVEEDLRQRYVAPGEELGLEYGGGDGQVAPRGEIVPRPLRVYVAGYLATSGVRAQFSLSGAEPQGVLYRSLNDVGTDPPPTDTSLILTPDFDGYVECYWRLPDDPSILHPPRVTATLIDENDDPVGNAIVYHAWFSNADRVQYYRSNRAKDAMSSPDDETDVQVALDDLYKNVAILHYVGGTGQSAGPRQRLGAPLQVRLGDGSWGNVSDGISVRFEVVSGDGILSSATPIPDELTGIYACNWTLGNNDPQMVKAYVDFGGAPITEITPITFTAEVHEAADATYYRSDLAKDAMSTTADEASVQQVIDNLYDNAAILHYVGGTGQSAIPGDVLQHPLQVRIANGTWSHDGEDGPAVRFRILSGGGSLIDGSGDEEPVIANEVSPTPDSDTGIYACQWRIGDAGSLDDALVVEAYTYFATDGDGDEELPVTPIRFTASFDAAAEIQYSNDHNADVATVADALDDLYDEATRIHYVDGDGQVAIRGDVLARPLVVEVSGYESANDRLVRFSLPDSVTSPGMLYNGDPVDPDTPRGKSLNILTDGAGRARCYWRPLDHDDGVELPVDNTAVEIPAVTATLMDGPDRATSRSVTFNAWLSNADRTRFCLGARAKDAMSTTADEASVQQAIDDLYDNAAILHYVGGAGQSAIPGDVLQHPLQVRIANGAWRHDGEDGPAVRFRILSGGGSLIDESGDEEPIIDTEVFPTPDSETGIYACQWRIGDAGSPDDALVVEAYAYFATDGDGDEELPVTPIRFTASFDAAAEIQYSNAHNADVETVADALDDLYDEATRIHYVDGDGQVAIRGDVLARPLVVEVSGYESANDRLVRFSLPDSVTSPGMLYNGDPVAPDTPRGKSLNILTDGAGRARCYWRPLDHDDGVEIPVDNTAVEIPAVTATLMDGPDRATSRSVTFNAWLGNADRVEYHRSARARDAMSTTADAASVQQVIDNLYDNAAILHYVAGTGQSAIPGDVLQYPLQVRIANGAWSHDGDDGPAVRFRILSGGGSLIDESGDEEPIIDTEVFPTPDSETGIYGCQWRIGDAAFLDDALVVEAYAYFATDGDGDEDLPITPVRFTASFDAAAEIQYSNAHNADVATVAGALDDLYDEATRIHYISGDGQVAARGQALQKPLVVEVSGYEPVADRVVRFSLPNPDTSPGTLYNGDPGDGGTPRGKTLDITTDSNGRARCYWAPLDHAAGADPLDDSTQAEIPAVTATLLEADGAPSDRSVTFNAWLSNADRTRFYVRNRASGAMAADVEQTSVQEALEDLYKNAAILHYVSGTGQSGSFIQPLGVPLRVRFGDGFWDATRAGATVGFAVVAGEGTLSAVTADPAAGPGVYQCTWTLGPGGAQEARAFIDFGDGTEVSPVLFSAEVDEASDTLYSNDHSPGVATVAAALDDLYDEATRIHYVDGDGQVAIRGDVLARPLVVEVSGYESANDRLVRFSLPDSLTSPGMLYNGDPVAPDTPRGKSLNILTDGAGRARCYWRPLDHDDGVEIPVDNTAVEIPAVTATLMDGPDRATSRSVTFNAWLGNADRARFYLNARARAAMASDAEQGSVQQALDHLHDNEPILHYVNGNGQSGRHGEDLAVPLRVRFGDGTRTPDLDGATVHFAVVQGEGAVSGPALDPDTGAGVYQCTWTLGTSGVQEVKAYIEFDDAPTSEFSPVFFTATVQDAATANYINPDDEVQTVEDALNSLHARMEVPVGTILEIASATAPPTPPPGFLLCDGRPVIQSEYGALYAQIGNAFGSEVEEGYFRLPALNPEIPADPPIYQFIKR